MSPAASRDASRVARPLRRIADDLERVARFDLDGDVGRTSRVREIAVVLDEAERMKASLRSFGCYVPTEVVRDLVARGGEARLGGVRRNLTVLFADAVGFTRLAEGMDPSRLAEHLGCEATKEAVAATRRDALAADPPAYNRRLWEAADVAGLIYDEGYPQPTITMDEFAADSGARLHRVARIEPFIVELREQAGSFRELEEAFEAELERAAADPGLVAFKSVIASRVP